MPRDAAHYREMLADNPSASIGASLAARMIATIRGEERDEDIEVNDLQRLLMSRYGEDIAHDDVVALCDADDWSAVDLRGGPRPGAGRPAKFARSSVLSIRVPTDVANRIREADAHDQVAEAAIAIAQTLPAAPRPRKPRP